MTKEEASGGEADIIEESMQSFEVKEKIALWDTIT